MEKTDSTTMDKPKAHMVVSTAVYLKLVQSFKFGADSLNGFEMGSYNDPVDLGASIGAAVHLPLPNAATVTSTECTDDCPTQATRPTHSNPPTGTLGCWLQVRTKSHPDWRKVALTSYEVVRPAIPGYQMDVDERTGEVTVRDPLPGSDLARADREGVVPSDNTTRKWAPIESPARMIHDYGVYTIQAHNDYFINQLDPPRVEWENEYDEFWGGIPAELLARTREFFENKQQIFGDVWAASGYGLPSQRRRRQGWSSGRSCQDDGTNPGNHVSLMSHLDWALIMPRASTTTPLPPRTGSHNTTDDDNNNTNNGQEEPVQRPLGQNKLPTRAQWNRYLDCLDSAPYYKAIRDSGLFPVRPCYLFWPSTGPFEKFQRFPGPWDDPDRKPSWTTNLQQPGSGYRQLKYGDPVFTFGASARTRLGFVDGMESIDDGSKAVVTTETHDPYDHGLNLGNSNEIALNNISTGTDANSGRLMRIRWPENPPYRYSVQYVRFARPAYGDAGAIVFDGKGRPVGMVCSEERIVKHRSRSSPGRLVPPPSEGGLRYTLMLPIEDVFEDIKRLSKGQIFEVRVAEPSQ